jgi:hypothetical protein
MAKCESIPPCGGHAVRSRLHLQCWKTFGSHCASNHPDSAQKISMVDCHMKSSVRFFVSMPISNASPAR